VASGYQADRAEITPAPGTQVRPVDPRLVDQSGPENVLLGEPERVGSAYCFRVLRPTPGTVLSDRGDGGYAVETFIESGRQMSTLLAHTVAGHPLGTRFLWCTLDADLPWSLPADAAPALLCSPERSKGRRVRYSATLVGTGAGEFHGSVRYGCAALSAASFQRVRAARAGR
jgi:hypothetical protein